MEPDRFLKKDIAGKTFSVYTVELAWARSVGRCECVRIISHGHRPRCTQRLNKHCRGKDLPHGWQACRIVPTGPAVLGNCEILCWKCYKKIQTSEG